MIWFQVFLCLWSVTSCLYSDKIHKVAKTKVSNPKRYSLSKLRLVHSFLKRLHKSTSLCGKICITPPKCLRKERRRNFYSRCSIVVVETLCVPKYGKGNNRGIRPITAHQITGQSEHTVLFRTKSFVKIDTFQKGGAERSNNNVWYVENNVIFEP